jgi:hypothetical protein
MHVLVDYVSHEVGMCGILAHGPDGHAMRTIAGDVL